MVFLYMAPDWITPTGCGGTQVVGVGLSQTPNVTRLFANHSHLH